MHSDVEYSDEQADGIVPVLSWTTAPGRGSAFGSNQASPLGRRNRKAVTQLSPAMSVIKVHKRRFPLGVASGELSSERTGERPQEIVVTVIIETIIRTPYYPNQEFGYC